VVGLKPHGAVPPPAATTSQLYGLPAGAAAANIYIYIYIFIYILGLLLLSCVHGSFYCGDLSKCF
jgi:hypothetical protein